jgi:hypothetical protein
LGGGICTAGYAVWDNVDKVTKMVTAGHCNPLWGQWQTKAGADFGYVERRDKNLDAELITSKQHNGTIWTGGTAESDSSVKVTNWSGWTYLGRQLCVSGQTTFNHCGHPVSQNGVAVNYSALRARYGHGAPRRPLAWPAAPGRHAGRTLLRCAVMRRCGSTCPAASGLLVSTFKDRAITLARTV